MLSLSRAGIVGASVAVAGGVAFLIWNYASSSGEEKPETRLGEVGESDREQREGEKDEIREEETPVIKAQQQQTQCAEPTTAVVEPVAAAEVRNTSQVTFTGHTCVEMFRLLLLKHYICAFTPAAPPPGFTLKTRRRSVSVK